MSTVTKVCPGHEPPPPYRVLEAGVVGKEIFAEGAVAVGPCTAEGDPTSVGMDRLVPLSGILFSA